MDTALQTPAALETAPAPAPAPVAEATPAPASAPAPEPAAAEEETSSNSNVDWGALANESDIPDGDAAASLSDLDVEATVPVKAVPGAAIAPPATPPAPVAAATQPVTPPPSVTPQSTSTPEPTAPVTPAQAAAPIDLAQKRTEYLQELAQTYAMTEEEGVELLRSPETVLPKLAAQLQLNIAEQTIQQLARILPQFMDTHLNQKQTYAKNQESFFEEWPDLNKPEYTDTLTRIAVTYRQQNPGATKERAIKEIGAIAAIALGVVPAASTPPETVQPIAPVQPAHRPVMPGGGVRPVSKVTNEFTALANEWGDD